MNNLDGLTLEEAIAHAEEVAEDAKLISMMVGIDHVTELEQTRCANEHKQLAEWLKELKSLKENKIGHWIERDFVSPGTSFTVYQCSECNEISWNQYNYCPECGMRMKGAEDEVQF